ncbi:hypothetical protein ABJI51_14600 [Amycolatopsis sp. NEAU-NG30]|uniref:Uncharacterized protein n=1 Tax=Amycolatopsis melonis TaxID=3156488 RepID=A0ABV0LDE4_9PSEU
MSAAIIAAVASLAGVTLGALVEPVKLNAARRAKLRQDRAFYGLLVMSGPDELVDQAKELRAKEMELHHTRFELDTGRKFERRFLPPPVREASAAFDRAIEDFAVVARKHTS